MMRMESVKCSPARVRQAAAQARVKRRQDWCPWLCCSGISINEVYDQLKGIRCPSTIRQQGMSCTSCPDAIAKVVMKVSKLIEEQPKERAGYEMPTETPVSSETSHRTSHRK